MRKKMTRKKLKKKKRKTRKKKMKEKRWMKRKMMVLKMQTTMSGAMVERMRKRDHRPLNLCKGSLNQEPLRFFSVR